MSKKQRNSGDKDRSEKPLSALEILSRAGRKKSKSRIEKYRKSSAPMSRSAEDKQGSGEEKAQKRRSDEKPGRPVRRRSEGDGLDRDRGQKRDYKKGGRGRGSSGSSGQKKKSNRQQRSPSSQLNSQSVAQKDYLREEIRLNKYIAHAGLCSRREADEYIEQGKVKVNGKVITELGTKVKSSDKVEVDQQKLSLEPFVYILLNKGRDTISTTDDEKDRNTVVDAIEGATGHRVYPVGRLDRNTMGLLILTNDGDLAHRLMHPSFKVKKTYEVSTSVLLTDDQLNELRGGITLEDGPVQPAGVKRDPMNPYITTISVFEGRNHLIRRIVGYFGADVTKLVRTRYAGLTDRNTRVGRWRYLKQKEINDLRKLVKLDTLAFNKDS